MVSMELTRIGYNIDFDQMVNSIDGLCELFINEQVLVFVDDSSIDITVVGIGHIEFKNDNVQVLFNGRPKDYRLFKCLQYIRSAWVA